LNNSNFINLSESTIAENVTNIVLRWCTDKSLIKVQDFFNDNINYKVSCFEDCIRLNKDMSRVAFKYVIFDCTNTAISVIQSFLENLELLQTFLGEIELSLQDSKSSFKLLEEGKNKLENAIIEYKEQLSEVNKNEKNNTDSRKNEIKRLENLKELYQKYPVLTYEEAKKKEEEKASKYENYFVDSVILDNNTVQDLIDWLEKSQVVCKNICLLYRATIDSFQSSIFHQKCNNEGATITIVKFNNYIFGAYTPLSWTSCGDYQGNNGDNKSFIFSLRNPTNTPIKLTKKINTSNSIYDNPGNGPTFGGGHDLHISNNANSNTSSYTNLGHCYNCPEGYTYGTNAKTFFMWFI